MTYENDTELKLSVPMNSVFGTQLYSSVKVLSVIALALHEHSRHSCDRDYVACKA